MKYGKKKPMKSVKKKVKKKKKTMMTKETETAIKKDIGTFKKLTNFIKSLGKNIKNCMSLVMFNENLLDKIDKLPNAAHVKAGSSDINLLEGIVLHNELSYLLLSKLGYY